MGFNIADTSSPRVVIAGGGFAGLTLARKLSGTGFQVVLVDQNNYHQFQPLFYQVAMAGLEPSSIVFPFRKLFQKSKNIFMRLATIQSVDTGRQLIQADIGSLHYDYLVLAIGASTNYFGNEMIRQHVIPMKSVSEALYLRNQIFEDYEKAVTAANEASKQSLLDIVVVGGGPTGVEVAGALAEMKNHIVPKDYRDLSNHEIDIHLIHGNGKLLNTMSPEASAKAEAFLRDMGVNLWLDKTVTGYNGDTVTIDDGSTIKTKKVIWAAGITANKLEGLPKEVYARGGRIKVNAYNQVEGQDRVFAIGDLAFQAGGKYPDGHPQVVQVAIQQARLLARNLQAWQRKGNPEPFEYTELGSMATIGRNKAVADLPWLKTQGFIAWAIWLFVHLFAILGVKNKIFIFINWVWNYLTYDQSLRLVIRPFRK